jgi:hypothetical protein
VPRPLAPSDDPRSDHEFLEVAVCESNLAVLLAEFADGRLDWQHEALFLADRACGVVDKVVWRYEKDARRAAAKELSSGKAVLPELPRPTEVEPRLHQLPGATPPGSGDEAQLDSATSPAAKKPTKMSRGREGGGEGGGDAGSVGSGSSLVDGQGTEDDSGSGDEGSGAEEAAKVELALREALFVDLAVASCLELNVRVAQIVARHNKFRVLKREEIIPLVQAADDQSVGVRSPGQGSITSEFTEGAAASGGSDEQAANSVDDVSAAMEVAALAERAAAAEAMLQLCVQTFETAPPPAVAKAQSENPKLTPYIGLERLGSYPPPEFAAIFAARKQSELDAVAFAKRARKLEKQARKEAKATKLAARAARQQLKEDPFNVDLIEAAGFVERAKLLRAREAKREKMLEQWYERKALEDQKRAARALTQAAAHKGAEEAAAEAAVLRQQPRTAASAKGSRRMF